MWSTAADKRENGQVTDVTRSLDDKISTTRDSGKHLFSCVKDGRAVEWSCQLANDCGRAKLRNSGRLKRHESGAGSPAKDADVARG